MTELLQFVFFFKEIFFCLLESFRELKECKMCGRKLVLLRMRIFNRRKCQNAGEAEMNRARGDYPEALGYA